jgi:hypothetical protein
MGKWITVIGGVLAALIVGIELAMPAMTPETEAALHLGLGLAFGVGAAVLLGVALRL